MSLEATVAYLTQKKQVIHGKKAFQKYMYFLDIKGVPTQLNYRIYHFGPYSSELDYKTDNLELMGALLMEKVDDKFVIRMGDKSTEIVEQNKSFLDLYSDIIDQVIQTLPDKPNTLELWSTVHFVAKSMHKMYYEFSKPRVVEEVRNIKQEKFSLEQIEETYEKLFQLGFLP